jgi:hypothetical protein
VATAPSTPLTEWSASRLEVEIRLYVDGEARETLQSHQTEPHLLTLGWLSDRTEPLAFSGDLKSHRHIDKNLELISPSPTTARI